MQPTAEKTSDVDEKGVAVANGDEYASGIHHYEGSLTFEDRLHYADLQYANNGMPYEGEEGKPSPAQGIAKSPLRWIWGGPSPGAFSGKETAFPAKPLTSTAILDRRQLRKVTAFGAFYLITTDILGPFNAGFAISQVGFVPGVILYFVMGAVAFYTGIILNALYLRLDSDRAPLRNFGHVAQCIWGNWGKAMSDSLMLIQLLFNCGAIMLSNGQSLSQIINNAPSGSHLCFAVCIVIFLIINLLLSPMRTLKSVGWIANLAVWLNIALIWCTVGFVYSSPPNFAAAKSAFGIDPGPVETHAFVQLPLSAKVNGIGNMIFAYGGAMIFIDFLNEMKRPWDFWKAMACAQTLIATLYLTFGILVYARQGQFTQSLAYFGVSPYSMQTVGNVIAVITGTIAAVLYGNIAQKAVYYLVVEQLFKGPPLMTTRGWMLWMVVNVIWWPLSFVVGAAIPQVQTITGLIGSACILQFTYTFPFFLKFSFDLKLDASRGDGAYETGRAARVDTWRDWSRWRRGLFTGNVLSKFIHFTLGLACLAMACLGMYGSGVAIQQTFQASASTSFGCTPPA